MIQNDALYKKIINNFIYNKYGNYIFKEDGKLNISFISSMMNLNDRKKLEILEKKGSLSNNIIIDTREKNNQDIISIIFGDSDDINSETLIMIVPEKLRKEIIFQLEYILSGFDKIQNAISSIKEEFKDKRMGIIINLEKELYNCNSEFTEYDKSIILNCIGDVGNILEETKQSIISMCDRVDNIPRDRKKRLFRTPINSILADVRLGRNLINIYIYGSIKYAVANMKFERRNAAINRLNEAIKFLQNMMEENRFQRVEQWNEKKDKFWENGIQEQVQVLQNALSEIMSYSGKILI